MLGSCCTCESSDGTSPACVLGPSTLEPPKAAEMSQEQFEAQVVIVNTDTPTFEQASAILHPQIISRALAAHFGTDQYGALLKTDLEAPNNALATGFTTVSAGRAAHDEVGAVTQGAPTTKERA